jgi:hypothetical protein
MYVRCIYLDLLEEEEEEEEEEEWRRRRRRRIRLNRPSREQEELKCLCVRDVLGNVYPAAVVTDPRSVKT